MTIDRDQVLKALRAAPVGLRIDELAKAMGADAKGKHRVRALLAELLEDAAVEKAPNSKYRLVGMAVPEPGLGKPGEKKQAREGQIPGRLRVHPAGYGFVVREDGEDDVFIPAKYRGNALDGDRVALSTWQGYKGTEGRVEEVLERGRAKLTGILHGVGRAMHLEPDDPRIAATGGHVQLEEGSAGARDGQAVVVEITKYPSRPDEAITARIIHVLGSPDDPRTEVEKVIICSDIPNEFPTDVIDASERAPDHVRPSDLVDRIDLRERHFMTIDPETARDFDDAVCVEASPKAGHSRLWVAVADVSHYVRPGQALDREARTRGCSVYLPDRAIPMLPRPLSAGICSLNPEVDRLAMVVRLEVDSQGGVSDPYFCAAVIRSHARLDYAGVAAALAGDFRGPRARYREFLPKLEELREVAGRLRKRRSQRGSLDFDLPEAKVVLDEDDPTRVRDVVQSRADLQVKGAYQMVEDFMLAANEAVARHFRERELDTLWRVHDIPSEERLDEFAEIAHAFGLEFDPEDGRDPRKMRDFLETLRGRPMERALNFLLLRTLKQAVYDVVNVGHFGLGAKDYLHFTSPIRRYPDLIVHRLLKASLHQDGLAAGGPPPPVPPRPDLQAMASESSSNERRAMEAEREVVDMYRAFLMRDRIGEEFEGTIAGVMGFGFFVQIESPFIEGLVKVDTLNDDHYALDGHTQRLVGKRSGRAFALGDKVKVRIENVSVTRRKIDMVLEGHVSVPTDIRAAHAARPPRPTRREGLRVRGAKKPDDPRTDRKNRGRPGKPDGSNGRPSRSKRRR
jgi:ribonuclease R